MRPLVVSVPVGLAVLAVGTWALACLDLAVGRRVAGAPLSLGVLAEPVRGAVRLLFKERRATEAPDDPAWLLGPLLLAMIAGWTAVVVPLSPGRIAADLNVGIVFFSGFLILALVAVFLTGWGPNSTFAMIGGFRFVGAILAYGSAFAITIISVALPAESLAVGDIVSFQIRGVWNAVLQPLGFAIYLVLAHAVTFWGPLAFPTSRDLAGGIESELSGAPALVWTAARYAVVLVVSAFGAAMFLGGWHGPVLPAEVWMAVKTFAIGALLVWTRWSLPVVRPERFMRLGWIVLLPVSLANVFVVGVILLLVRGLGR